MKIFNKVLSVTAIVLGSAFIYRIFNGKEKISSSRASEKINDSTNDYNSEHAMMDRNRRTQKMFKDLGMTDKQKERYESSVEAFRTEFEEQNPNVSMDDKIALDEEDKFLKAVLTEIQYGMYRDWTKKNM